MKLTPFLFRDMRQGRYAPSSVDTFLIPDNSVKHAVNVNFDTTVGVAKVRPGSTLFGTTVASAYSPLGLAEFVGKGGTPNILIAVFSNTSTGYIYASTTVGSVYSWRTSGTTNLSNTAKNRFAVLGGSIFTTNSTDGMKDSTNGTSWVTTNSIASANVKPSLVYSYKKRLICAGDPTYPSKVWFSSVIDSVVSPFITWSVDPTTGNWIDINPDDGGQITGFSQTSAFVLVFKGNAMYRLNTVSKTVDTENIFNIGAVSQEAIVTCQGLTYFFSGQDIRVTDGTYPQQISRAGVQDILDAVTQANWSSVAAGTDGFNVYFYVGNVTLNSNQDDQQTINNCVLKYSTRDKTWSVHSYANAFTFFSQFTGTVNGRTMMGADTGGNVQFMNVGTTDNGTAINFLLETQEQEFGNRAHLKEIKDKLVVLTQYGQDSSFDVKENDNDFTTLNTKLSNRVNVCEDVNLRGNYFTFRWRGQSNAKAPVFGGYYVEDINDLGINV